MVGQTIGKLKVLEFVPHHSKSGSHYKVICECGVGKIVNGSHMRKGRTLSCGCKRFQENVTERRKRPYESLYNLFSKNKHVEMSYEEFLTFTERPCHYCNVALAWQKYSVVSTRYMLDRKDNTKGYVVENCVPCCRDCNYGKGNRYTYEEWKVIVNALTEYRSKNVRD